MTRDWQAWIEAGRLLAEDPTRAVVCPACGQAVLQVLDVPLPDGVGLERHLTCPGCGETNSLLIRRPAERGL